MFVCMYQRECILLQVRLVAVTNNPARGCLRDGPTCHVFNLGRVDQRPQGMFSLSSQKTRWPSTPLLSAKLTSYRLSTGIFLPTILPLRSSSSAFYFSITVYSSHAICDMPSMSLLSSSLATARSHSSLMSSAAGLSKASGTRHSSHSTRLLACLDTGIIFISHPMPIRKPQAQNSAKGEARANVSIIH